MAEDRRSRAGARGPPAEARARAAVARPVEVADGGRVLGAICADAGAGVVVDESSTVFCDVCPSTLEIASSPPPPPPLPFFGISVRACPRLALSSTREGALAIEPFDKRLGPEAAEELLAPAEMAEEAGAATEDTRTPLERLLTDSKYELLVSVVDLAFIASEWGLSTTCADHDCVTVQVFAFVFAAFNLVNFVLFVSLQGVSLQEVAVEQTARDRAVSVLGGLGVGDRHSLWCAVAMVLVVMHIFRRVKSIHMICAGLARAIPGVLNMIILMVFLASGFARIGVAIFAGAGAEGAKYFGTFFRAMLTMFQVFTPGSNWAEDIARPLMSTQSSPAVSLFFIVYLILFWLLLGPIVRRCGEDGRSREEQEQPDSESEGRNR